MIYMDHWDLTRPPFVNDSLPDSFVPTRGAALAIARLQYSLGMGMGASALFGEAGVGKTRIARMVLEEFTQSGWRTAYLPSPLDRPRDILAVLSPEAAAAIPAGSDGTVELYRLLEDQIVQRQPVALVVDDAHTARGTDFLESLRTMLNVEHDGIKALSILLVGQPELDRKLAASSNFDSQLQVRAVLEPMQDDETRLYILARLKSAGSHHGIFTKQAAERVVTFSQGNPRQVNRLCELAMVIAYGLDQKKITPDIVEMAAADLDLLPSSQNGSFLWPHAEAPVREKRPAASAEPEEVDILASLDRE